MSRVRPKGLEVKALKCFAEQGPMSPYDLKRRTGMAYSSAHTLTEELSERGRVRLIDEGKNVKGAPRKVYGLTLDGLIAAIGSVGADLNLPGAIEKNADLFSSREEKADRDLMLTLWGFSPGLRELITNSCESSTQFYTVIPSKIRQKMGRPSALTWVLSSLSSYLIESSRLIPDAILDPGQLASLKTNSRLRHYARELWDKRAEELRLLDDFVGSPSPS